MALATKAIVLSALKYGDTSLIVRLYTEQAGLQAFILRGILGRRKGPLRPGHFQPLSQLEVVAAPSRTGKLGYLREAVVRHPYKSLHTDVRKEALALFLAEVLAEAIREEEANPALYAYLEEALHGLDREVQVANFHVAFLLGLSRYLGFYPDTAMRDAPYFDLVEGAFCLKPGLNPVLEGPELAAFRQVLGTEFVAIQALRLSQKDRRSLLNALIQYYEIHLHGFRRPKSLTILHEIFS